MTTKEGWVEVPGGRIWYVVHGGNRRGVPLVLLHGGPGVPHDYLLPLSALADERPVIFYDQLGCGRSVTSDDGPENWVVSRFVAELHALCLHLQLKEFLLLGQSWGAFLAVNYALAYPDQGLRGMILSGPCLSAPRWTADLRRLLALRPADEMAEIIHCEMTGDYQSYFYQRIMDRFYHEHVCKLDPWPECMTRSVGSANQQLYKYMWGGSEFSVTGTLKDEDLSPQLSELTVPVQYICGRDDEATPETTHYYSSLTPDSSVVVIENASHVHHLEQPEIFFTAVRLFLKSL